MAIHFDIVRDGRHFSARPDKGTPFRIAEKVRYRNKRTGTERFGLSNDGSFFGSQEAKQCIYTASAFSDIYQFWSEFIEPTAICEGQSFISLNTYDRARFTFGFGQLAVHVPDGDFILWFRDMLRRPESIDYFPNLQVESGRIVKIENGKSVEMESKESTEPLQKYLNPTLDDVEDAEVIAAAKLIHWTTTHTDAQLLQVQHMVNTARRLMREADRRLGLDERTADLCCIIMDVRHQGRAGFDDLQRALLDRNPYAALLDVGSAGEPERCRNLTAALQNRRAGLRRRRWSRALGDFV